MSRVVEHWLGPDSEDRYRAMLMALLALFGVPVAIFEIVVHVEDHGGGPWLAGVALLTAVVVVGSRGRLQAGMPFVAAPVLAVLVAFTGGLDSHLNVAFLLLAVGSAFLHETRWFVANVVWLGAVAMLPYLYDVSEVASDETEAGLVQGVVLVAAVVVVHVLSQVLRARNRHLQAVLEEQQRTIAQLHEAQQTKDLFLSALSHELRTPLTSIVGLGQTLQVHDGDLGPEQRVRLVERLVVNGRRLERLLTDLLDLRRLQQGAADLDLGVVGLPELVDVALGGVAVDGRTHHVEVPDVTVRLDRSKVERILANLVTNACKHTPVGSHVWTRLSVADATLCIVVEDDGPGVPDDLKAVVFDSFQQGPQSRQDPSPGTGVGLAIVAEFARLHGGRAWVEDRPGGGARFHVHLAAHGRRRTARATAGLPRDPLMRPGGPHGPR